MAVKSSTGDGIVQVLYKDLTEVINKIEGAPKVENASSVIKVSLNGAASLN